MPYVFLVVADHTRFVPEYLAPPPFRALLEIGGVPAIEKMLQALGRVSRLSMQVLTTDEDPVKRVLAPRRQIPIHGARANPVDLIREAVQDLPDEDIVVFMPGDLPFVSKTEVEELIRLAGQEPGVVCPVVKTITLPPGLKKKSLVFQEGELCPGYALAAHRRVLTPDLFRRIDQVLQGPTQLLKNIGGRFLLKMLFSKPHLGEAEELASSHLGVPVRLVIMPSAGFARNLSSEEDLTAAGVL
ncbi:MAG TPA: NTP transferase domain-containing protein [Candidatus Ozemobacteraceae bacterium]|nr:NTP transferase domain-containing protein [Candidatus Ozemobacteraceae bacterium]